MKGVKGCFICGQDHMEDEKHITEDLKAAINKMKPNYQRALLSIDKMAAVVERTMCDEEVEDEDNDRWLQYEEDGEEIAMITKEDA